LPASARHAGAKQDQRVYSASSSKASAQDLPQKRRTLSSGFSQYQHEPLGGRLWRVGTDAPLIDAAIETAAEAAAEATTSGSMGALLSAELSCIVSKLTPLQAARQ
jgi:hypothetical protein